MTIQVMLSPKFIAGLTKRGQRYVVYDRKVPGFAVRVSEKGTKSFILSARFSKGAHQTRRFIGDAGGPNPMKLTTARKRALAWLAKISDGIDPKEEAEREREAREAQRRAKALQDAQKWAALAERYIAEHLGETGTKRDDGEVLTYKLRRGKDDAREIRNHLIPPWCDKPITEITPQDVKALIKPIGRKTPALAHLLLNHIKRVFSWALNDDVDYGIKVSPAALLKPEKLIGTKRIRTRVLGDDELFAFWRATGRLRYPMGDLYRLIALTGVRISEASDAEWPEFNFRDRLWTIPPERFKSEQKHLVPLSDRALVLLSELPEWTRGTLLFTTTGTKPVGGFSKPKVALDTHMLTILRAVARKRGDDPGSVRLEHFVIHDVRRTVRTRLSELQVKPHVAELVIGHGKKGLERVYNQAEHLPEMRDALERWADRLAEIIGERSPESGAGKVVKLAERRALQGV